MEIKYNAVRLETTDERGLTQMRHRYKNKNNPSPIRVYTSLALRLRKRKLLTFVPGAHMHLCVSVSIAGMLESWYTAISFFSRGMV